VSAYVGSSKNLKDLKDTQPCWSPPREHRFALAGKLASGGGEALVERVSDDWSPFGGRKTCKLQNLISQLV